MLRTCKATNTRTGPQIITTVLPARGSCAFTGGGGSGGGIYIGITAIGTAGIAGGD